MENLRAALAARLAVAAATLILIANLLGIPASGAEPGASEVGVFDNRILFGQSAALEGSAAALGLGMREGILAAFNEVNAAGGVKGRRLELVSRNDGYEPDKAIENTNQLLKVDQVFALIGEVGTPTSKAAQPIATAAGVPFIGPFTGAAFLRDPTLASVINVRASYDQETEAWVERLTTDLGISRIALFYQDDSFGLGSRDGSICPLSSHPLQRRRPAPSCEERWIQVTRRESSIYQFGTERRSTCVGEYGVCSRTVFQRDASYQIGGRCTR